MRIACVYVCHVCMYYVNMILEQLMCYVCMYVMYLRVFDGSSSQENVFEKTVTDTVSAVMTGFNACILCYGQTG